MPKGKTGDTPVSPIPGSQTNARWFERSKSHHKKTLRKGEFFMVGPDGLLFASLELHRRDFCPRAKPAIPPSRLSLVVKPTPVGSSGLNLTIKKTLRKGEFFYGCLARKLCFINSNR